MKHGLVVSGVLHGLVLTWGLWSLSAPAPLEATYAEALPVEIVMSDVFEGVKGEKTGAIREKPAPKPTTKPQTLPMPAENTGDNEADLATPPVPDVKPNKVEPKAQPKAATPPPPTPEPVKTAEATPPPPKPQPKAPDPEPQPKAAAAPEPKAAEPLADPVEEAIKAAADEPQPEADPAPRNVPVPQKKPPLPETKVAEADKPAETEAKPTRPEKAVKPDKVKPAKVADAPREETSDFNADDIAALLSKEKASGGGARRSTEVASLGSRKTTGTKLSRSEIGELQGLIQDQMSRCWSPPTGVAEAGSLRISIEIRFNPSGELDGTPTIVEGGGGSGIQRIASEAALRAIRRCAPFNLPADKYDGGWDVTKLNFDPSQMN